MNDGRCLSFGSHVADSDVAPGFHVNKRCVSGDAMTHLMWTAMTLCVFTFDVMRVRDRGGDGGRRGRVGKNRMFVTDSSNNNVNFE